MGGRPSKPSSLIKFEKKSHRTKAELEAREKSEKALYSGYAFRETARVKSNKLAHETFTRLKKMYEKIDFVEGLDEAIINRYCLITADVASLEKLIERMEQDIDSCEDYTERIKLYKTISGTLLTLKSNREMLLKLEDRLFLNPVARIKSIPKQPKEETDIDDMERLLNKRGS